MTNSIADIAQKLIIPSKHLVMEGIPIHAYLTELTWLLFLKIAPALDEKNRIPTDFNWDSLINKRGEEQFAHYQEIIKALEKHSEPRVAGLFAYARTAFQYPEQLTQVISILAAVDAVLIDDLGEVFEILLEKCSYEDNNRLCLPPRSLVDMMVILTQPQLGESIQDPLAGTANFIVATMEYIQVTNDESLDLSSAQKNIIAIEPDLVRQRLALMNCLLHQIEHPQRMPVRWGDSLLSNLQTWPQADLILSMLVNAHEQTDELAKHDASLALLQHIYQTLKPGGRAAVVVPDLLLNAMGPAHKVRSTLLDTCVVHTVLRLPDGIFYPHKVQAHLLFFNKGFDQTKNIWFYDLRTDLYAFGQNLHLMREHLKPFEMVYGDDPNGEAVRKDKGESGRWRCFSRDSLINDRLDLCWLEDICPPANNMMTDEAREVLDETIEDLFALTGILSVSH
jgi:type I restriction enzyme M protein